MADKIKQREELKNEIAEELKGNLFDEKKTEILSNFCEICNNYSSNYPDLNEAIFAEPEIFFNFTILASACAIYMGHTWEFEEKQFRSPHWDKRKEASEAFCQEHQDVFKKIFADAAGFQFPLLERQRSREFWDDVDLFSSTLTRHSSLWRELLFFMSEHPTLKQKCMGLFCRILGEGGIYPELLRNVEFPFI